MTNKKILFVYPNGNFIGNLVAYLSKNNQVETYDTEDRPLTADDEWEIMHRIKEADLVFFEWCAESAQFVTHLDFPLPPIVIRTHSNEVLVGKDRSINWSKVDLALFTNTHVREVTRHNKEFNVETAVIFPEIDTEFFTPPKQKERTCSLGFSGNLNWKKNAPLLLYCYKALRKWKPFTLRVAGDFEDTRTYFYFQHYVTENKLPIKLGKIGKNEMPAFYHSCDYLINTSIWEGCFYSGCEAMASGCIPLIHNWWGAKTLFPPQLVFNDPDHMVDIIRGFEDSYFEKMSFCRGYAASNFSTRNLKLIEYELDKVLEKHDNK